MGGENVHGTFLSRLFLGWVGRKTGLTLTFMGSASFLCPKLQWLHGRQILLPSFPFLFLFLFTCFAFLKHLLGEETGERTAVVRVTKLMRWAEEKYEVDWIGGVRHASPLSWNLYLKTYRHILTEKHDTHYDRWK